MGKFLPTESPSTSASGGKFVPDIAQPLTDELDPNKYSPLQIEYIKSGKFTKADIDEFNAQNLSEKINAIGPDLSGTATAAALGSFVRGVPAAFGGVGGMAASAPLANALRPIPRVGPLLSGGVTLGSGVLGSILAGLGNEKLHPTSPEEAQLAQEHQVASMAGGIGANALFFKPGLALELMNRLKAASIGGGIQGVSELVNAPEGQTVGEGALGRIAESAGINALLNNPTKLSEAILGPGNLAASAAKKTKSSAIIDSLGNASTKSSLPETTAAANDIALAPTKPLDIFSQIDSTTGKSAQESASVFPEVPPAKAASESAKVFERTPTNKELVADTQADTLGDLIGQTVEYVGETGKLIRDEEGNFLIVRDIQSPGKAPFIEVADTGKNPDAIATTLGVKSKIARDAANYSENLGPSIKYRDFKPNPRPVKGRFVPDKPVEAVKTPVAEQIPVKPTEAPSKAVSEPVQSKEGYLKELLDSKEITKEEYDAQIKGAKLASGVDPTELPAAIKHLTGLAKKGIEGLNDKLNERVAAVETAQANVATPEDVAPTPVLDNPNPNYQWKPWISKIPLIGKVAKMGIGIADENIGAISPRVMGGVRSREAELSTKRTKWNRDTLPFGQMLRKAVSPQEFQALDLAIQNGQHEAVKQALATHPEGNELIAAFETAKASLGEQLYESNIVGRDVGELTNYWPRRVHDYDGLRAELGYDEQGVLDKAIINKQKELGRPLTNSEKGEVLNQSISLQLRGKPGFLQKRTIDQIQKNWLQYYEPFDVSMEGHINRVSRDVVNRKFLGKSEFSPEEPIGGDLGKILAEELQANPSFRGKNGKEAQKVVLDNLRHHLNNEKVAEDAITNLANNLGSAVNFLHIGDVSSAISQFGDVFNSIHNYGLSNAVKGHVIDPIKAAAGIGGDKLLKLADVNIHEGHAETAFNSRSSTNSKTKRFVSSVIENTVGWADRFMKEGSLNSARHAFYDAVRDTSSPDFIKLNQKWSQRFPERWPEIVKDLQSKEFSEGKLNDNTRFFLYNELADIQPISMAQRAQLENASPVYRLLYPLHRYWVKQLNVMRAQGYEKLKNPATRLQGIRDLTSYAVIVGAIGGAAVSTVRDLLFGRELDPEDAALGGLAQLAGVTKYNIHQARQDGPAMAALSFLSPLAADAADLGNDVGLAIRSLRGDAGTPDDVVEFLQQARTTKNIPYVGREIYNWFGRGKTQEEKRQLQNAQGKGQPNTIQELGLLLNPPEKKK